MWYILNLDIKRARRKTRKCEQSVLKFEYGSILNFEYFKSFQHNDNTNANGRQAKHDSDIGQDKETLALKSLFYLNVAVDAQVCRLFCVVYMPLFGLVQAMAIKMVDRPNTTPISVKIRKL